MSSISTGDLVVEFGISVLWLEMVEIDLGVSQKKGYPKMDGENNGKPY